MASAQCLFVRFWAGGEGGGGGGRERGKGGWDSDMFNITFFLKTRIAGYFVV